MEALTAFLWVIAAAMWGYAAGLVLSAYRERIADLYWRTPIGRWDARRRAA